MIHTADLSVKTQERYIRTNTVSDLERRHLGADRSDLADGLMAGNQGKFGDELALVYVLQPCISGAPFRMACRRRSGARVGLQITKSGPHRLSQSSDV
jgi:hypothetical protein